MSSEISDRIEKVRQGFAAQGYMAHLEASLDDVGDGVCVISVPFSERLTQQHGLFHAGVTATLADNAGGFAAYTRMQGDEQPLSVEFKINLLDKALGDRLIARGRVIGNGRRVKVSRVEVFVRTDGAEKRVAIAIVTVLATRVRG